MKARNCLKRNKQYVAIMKKKKRNKNFQTLHCVGILFYHFLNEMEMKCVGACSEGKAY